MGILSSLYTGVSGMTAQGEALGVIGDNIANANTTGFKASRAEFQDIISKNLKGILGGNQIGRGVKIGAVNPILSQGNVDATEKVTDLAISGDGYFKVKGSDGESMTFLKRVPQMHPLFVATGIAPFPGNPATL